MRIDVDTLEIKAQLCGDASAYLDLNFVSHYTLFENEKYILVDLQCLHSIKQNITSPVLREKTLSQWSVWHHEAHHWPDLRSSYSFLHKF